MQNKMDLNFCFKGSRTYIHGTDIFTKITDIFNSDITKIDISFHGITFHNVTLSTQKPADSEIKIIFRCLDNGNKIILYGIENHSNVDCRYAYIEEKIVENSSIDLEGENIKLNTPSEYNFIEHVVAMNKALLESLYNDVEGKWYFTRLQLQEKLDMEIITSLVLTLKSNFQFKLIKTAIVVNKKEVGFIYFSLIPKES
jgi:hypothetical protein